MLRNMNQLRKEKTFILLVLLLIFIVITASILISVLLVIFNPQMLVSENIQVGVVSDHQVPRELTDVRRFEYTVFANESEAFANFANNTVSALILQNKNANNSNAIGYTEPFILDIIVGTDPLAESLFLALLKPALQRSEERYQFQRAILPDAIWPNQVDFGRTPQNGLHILFETIITLMIPFLLLIPIFLIGNLFVDSVSQEFEEGNMPILLTATSPLKYVHEHILQAFVINTVILGAFLLLLKARFAYLENMWSIYLYNSILLIPIILFALALVFVFQKKETAQLAYTFGVLAIFVLSPFFSFSPTIVIAEYLAGNTSFHLEGLLFVILLSIISYLTMRRYLRKNYYL